MYTATAQIEIRTPLTSGEGPAFFKMFEIQIEIVPSLRDWLLWIDKGYLPSYEEMPTLRPIQVKQLNENTFEFKAIMVLTPASDSLEYYQKLTTDGWKANDEEDDVIRERGYVNFKPKEFVKA